MVIPRGLGNSTATSDFAITNRLDKLTGIVDLKNKDILDVGCNDAAYTVELAQSAHQVVGIDVENQRLTRARQRVLGNHVSNLLLSLMSAEKLGLESNSLDIVFINEVLEHIPQQELALNEIHRVLKPKGYFILFAPNRLYPFETHGARIGSRKFGRFIPIIHWLPRFIGQHFMNARSYTPNELTELLSQHGMTVIFRSSLFPPLDGLRQRLERFHLALFVDIYRKLITTLSKIPGLRSMGLSVFIVAQIH